MSRMNSSKSQLFLMEFICVVLFFAICSALCVSAFVKADGLSKEGRALNEGLMLAQSVAEAIKNMENPEAEKITDIAKQLDQNDEAYKIKVLADIKEGMVTADIYIYNEAAAQNEICSLTVKRYLSSEVAYGK